MDYSIFLGAVLVSSPLGTSFGILSIGLFVFFGSLIIVTFIGSQYGLHNVMRENKYSQIRMIAPLLWHAMQSLSVDSDSEVAEVVLNLQQIHDALKKNSEWPFNVEQFVGLLVAVTTPLLAAVIQHFLP